MSEMNTPTPHNAARYGDIAKTVIMSGDPLRARFIAENYLQDPVLYNEVRGMFGYTGTYRGQRVSVQGHGMGIPSMGIYSYELFRFYDVEQIIRVGTCGCPDPDVPLGTLILASESVSDSNYGYQYGVKPGTVAHADPELVAKAMKLAEERGLGAITGKVFASDVFYDEEGKSAAYMDGVVGVEMESYALYLNADACGARALTMITVTDNLATDSHLSSAERQNGLATSIELALGLI